MATPVWERLAALMKTETRTVLAQSKLTPTESAELDEFVEYWRANGIPEATRSSAIRALLIDGLEKHTHEIGNSDG